MSSLHHPPGTAESSCAGGQFIQVTQMRSWELSTSEQHLGCEVRDLAAQPKGLVFMHS